MLVSQCKRSISGIAAFITALKLLDPNYSTAITLTNGINRRSLHSAALRSG
jgi:hypothetical protein